jgi:hypothetical protein
VIIALLVMVLSGMVLRRHWIVGEPTFVRGVPVIAEVSAVNESSGTAIFHVIGTENDALVVGVSRKVYVFIHAISGEAENGGAWIKVGDGTVSSTGEWSAACSLKALADHLDATTPIEVSMTAIVVRDGDTRIKSEMSIHEMQAQACAPTILVQIRRTAGTSGVVGDHRDDVSSPTLIIQPSRY